MYNNYFSKSIIIFEINHYFQTNFFFENNYYFWILSSKKGFATIFHLRLSCFGIAFGNQIETCKTRNEVVLHFLN